MWKEGDIIVIGNDNAKVLGVCGEVIFRSCSNDHESANTWDTQKSFEKQGWKLEDDDMIGITVQGKTTKISRQSAKALNLI